MGIISLHAFLMANFLWEKSKKPWIHFLSHVKSSGRFTISTLEQMSIKTHVTLLVTDSYPCPFFCCHKTLDGSELGPTSFASFFGSAFSWLG